MLARKSLLVLGADVLKSLFGFASTFFVARYLGAEALGTIGYLLSLVGTLALVSDLGLHQAFRKCASENPDDNGGFVSAFIVAKSALGLVLFALCALAPRLSTRLAAQLASGHFLAAYWSIAVFYLCGSFLSIPALTFQARREAARLTLPGTVGALVSSSVKVAVAIAGGSLGSLAAAYTLETAVGLMIGTALMWHYPLRRPSTAEIRHLLMYAVPTTLLTALAYVVPNADRILVERFWGAAEVGYYTAVLGLVSLMQRVPLAAMTVLFPQVAEDAARGDLRELARRTIVAQRYLLLLAVPLSVAVAAGSGSIVRLYLGEGFQRSGPILAALAFGPLLFALFEPYNTVVYAMERHRHLLVGAALGLFILLATTALLVPRSLGSARMLGLGALGAALASLAHQTVTGLYQLHLARRYAGVGMYQRAARLVGAGLAMSLVAVLILRPAPQSLARTALAAMAGLIAYIASLILMQELKQDDVRLFFDLMHPGRTLDYALGEIRRGRRMEPGEGAGADEQAQ